MNSNSGCSWSVCRPQKGIANWWFSSYIISRSQFIYISNANSFLDLKSVDHGVILSLIFSNFRENFSETLNSNFNFLQQIVECQKNCSKYW